MAKQPQPIEPPKSHLDGEVEERGFEDITLILSFTVTEGTTKEDILNALAPFFEACEFIHAWGEE